MNVINKLEYWSPTTLSRFCGQGASFRWALAFLANIIHGPNVFKLFYILFFVRPGAYTVLNMGRLRPHKYRDARKKLYDPKHSSFFWKIFKGDLKKFYDNDAPKRLACLSLVSIFGLI
jgi:hypothetical protein